MALIRVENCPADKSLNLAAAEVYAKLVGLECRVCEYVTYYDYPNDPGGRILIHSDPEHYVNEWNPSADIANAWDLLTALTNNRRCWFEVRNLNALADGTPARYGCNIEWLDKDQVPAWSIPRNVKVEADTAPLSITRAFLLASGVQEIETEIEKES